MGTNPVYFSKGGDGEARVSGLDTRRFPVENVSWEDAMEFCRRLSSLPEEKTACLVYRLPTEAEWEYACRAGTTTKWYCSDSESHLKQVAWFGEDYYSRGRTHPVGEKAPNAWGLYDMHGNVYEWCSDWYKEDYYKSSPVDDPQGPSKALYRVVRGGGWANDARFCRSANRYWFEPDRQVNFLGFRVALVPPGT
jgi:formylglycine-generating enzyme required for sulfatase activity